MHKKIGILLMVVVVIGYVVLSKDRGTSANGIGIHNSKESESKIAEIAEKLDNEYPEKPIEVVTAHNELMKLLYGQVASDEELEDYVHTIRKLYSKEFLNLNSVQTQLETLKSELETRKTQKLDLVASEIKEVYIVKDEKGEETQAEVSVVHATNEGSINRTYILVKENKEWKINSWKA